MPKLYIETIVVEAAFKLKGYRKLLFYLYTVLSSLPVVKCKRSKKIKGVEFATLLVEFCSVVKSILFGFSK